MSDVKVEQVIRETNKVLGLTDTNRAKLYPMPLLHHFNQPSAFIHVTFTCACDDIDSGVVHFHGCLHLYLDVCVCIRARVTEAGG